MEFKNRDGSEFGSLKIIFSFFLTFPPDNEQFVIIFIPSIIFQVKISTNERIEEKIIGLLHLDIQFLQKATAALHPPNPEAVFKIFLKGVSNKEEQMFNGTVTPDRLNPMLGKTRFSFME